MQQLALQFTAAAAAVLKPGASQPEVTTLPVSVQQLALQFTATAAAARFAVHSGSRSSSEVVTLPLSAEQRAPWIAQQPADMPTAHASSGRTTKLAAASVDAVSSQHDDTMTIAVQSTASSMALAGDALQLATDMTKSVENPPRPFASGASASRVLVGFGRRFFSDCDRYDGASSDGATRCFSA